MLQFSRPSLERWPNASSSVSSNPTATHRLGHLALNLSLSFLMRPVRTERAFTLLRKKKSLGWILIGVATPLILAGCALGLASGSVTILSVSHLLSSTINRG
jgi:hypothetical protein